MDDVKKRKPIITKFDVPPSPEADRLHSAMEKVATQINTGITQLVDAFLDEQYKRLFPLDVFLGLRELGRKAQADPITSVTFGKALLEATIELHAGIGFDLVHGNSKLLLPHVNVEEGLAWVFVDHNICEEPVAFAFIVVYYAMGNLTAKKWSCPHYFETTTPKFGLDHAAIKKYIQTLAPHSTRLAVLAESLGLGTKPFPEPSVPLDPPASRVE